MPYCLYIGAGLGGLAFLLIALNVIWWKCALRPIHTKKTPLHFPRQSTVQTITNSYPFRYFELDRSIVDFMWVFLFENAPFIVLTLMILLHCSDFAFDCLYLAIYSHFSGIALTKYL